MKKGHRWAPDITGQKFGKLTALKIDKVKRNGHTTSTYWLCECECGNFTSVEASRLKRGYTKSCGCLRRKNGNPYPDNKFDGLTVKNNRLYQIWLGMKSRCYNPTSTPYKDYGGRGVTVCDEWVNDFSTFYEWSMQNGYSDNLSIDRKDTNGNYDPSNCRWITQKEQSNNTRRNLNIEYKGEVHTFSEWMDILGLNYDVIYNRFHNLGWDVERAFETPIRKRTKNRKE